MNISVQITTLTPTLTMGNLLSDRVVIWPACFSKFALASFLITHIFDIEEVSSASVELLCIETENS